MNSQKFHIDVENLPANRNDFGLAVKDTNEYGTPSFINDRRIRGHHFYFLSQIKKIISLSLKMNENFFKNFLSNLRTFV